MVSRKWTMAISYATQAAQLSLAGAYQSSARVIAAFRGYQAQFEENSVEWWLCTEAFEDEWRYWFPRRSVRYFEAFYPTDNVEVPF